MTSQQILQAACRVAGVDPALVTDYKLTPAGAPVDILLKLMDGTIRRVELSALPFDFAQDVPAEIGPFPETDQPAGPLPEHATLAEPKPTTLEAQPPYKSKGKGRRNK